jgi:hypothetical protein
MYPANMIRTSSALRENTVAPEVRSFYGETASDIPRSGNSDAFDSFATGYGLTSARAFVRAQTSPVCEIIVP